MNDLEATDFSDWKPQRMSFKEARLEQLRYWQTRTMEERLAASWRLTCEGYAMLGIDVTQSETDFTLSRVTRRKR